MGVHVSITSPEGENLGSWYTSDSGEHTIDPPNDNHWELTEPLARIIAYLGKLVDNTRLPEDVEDCISAAYDFLDKISTED